MTLATNKQSKPFWAILLIIVIIFQTVSALFGGIVLILDPTGGLLKMPVSSLAHSPFSNFLVPGLVLFIALGLFPAFTAYCLIFRPARKWMNTLNIYKNRHAGWAYSLYTGLMLIVWIITQVALIGYGDIIQAAYAAVGILILILTLLPAVLDYYQRVDEPGNKAWRTL